jgi:hypothetical protein
MNQCNITGRDGTPPLLMSTTKPTQPQREMRGKALLFKNNIIEPAKPPNRLQLGNLSTISGEGEGRHEHVMVKEGGG